MTGLRAFAATILLLLAGAAPAAARDCRIPGAPPGVRVQPPPGCPETAPGPAKASDRQGVRAGRSPGTIVLENGTEIRIGGRVRVDAVGQR